MHVALPIDPRTGITAIGILPSGRVIWPIRGGADEPPADSPAQEPTDLPVDPKTAAVEAPKDETDWKVESRKWEQRARENREKAKKLDELESANATELEKAQKIAEQNEARAQQAIARAVSAEVKALADGFRVRGDALLHLRDRGDLARFVGDDGEIDEKAIAKELAAVLKERPDLAPEVAKPDPAKPGQRPTETLRPGAAPAEPERAGNLFDAVGAWASSQT